MKALSLNERIARRLRIVRVVALIDIVLLCALIISAITGQRTIVQVLGPLHGINYLLLLAIITTAAIDGLWSWWFPLATLLSGGAPGAFVGEWIIRRRLQAAQNIQASEHEALAIISTYPEKSTTSGVAALQHNTTFEQEETR